VGCLEPQFWKGFAEGIGLQSQYGSMSYGLTPLNSKNYKLIRTAVEQALQSKTAIEWEQHFTASSVKNKLPVLAIRTMEQSLGSDELVKLRNMTIEYNSSSSNEKQQQNQQQFNVIRVMKPGLDYSSFLNATTANNASIAAPRLGEHNDKFLATSKL